MYRIELRRRAQRAIDASEGGASLADTEGTMSLEAYLKSRRGKSKRTD